MNIGATFYRAMDIAFRGLSGQCVVVYLDDVTILFKRREDHVFHLKQIFGCCRKYGIFLNPKKIIFAVLEGKLLGHIISKKEILIDQERVDSINQIPMPHNRYNKFMGTINFVQRSVPDFSVANG